MRRLEPAGSHGVWGLDDYQFLPFYWGASQLIGHPMIKPKSIHNAEVLEGCSRDYLYLSCVDFVKQVSSLPPTSLLSCSIPCPLALIGPFLVTRPPPVLMHPRPSNRLKQAASARN